MFFNICLLLIKARLLRTRLGRAFLWRGELRRARALPVQEREARLRRAARDYLGGRITLDDYRRANDLYGIDYAAAVRSLAERRIRQQVRRAVGLDRED